MGHACRHIHLKCRTALCRACTAACSKRERTAWGDNACPPNPLLSIESPVVVNPCLDGDVSVDQHVRKHVLHPGGLVATQPHLQLAQPGLQRLVAAAAGVGGEREPCCSSCCLCCVVLQEGVELPAGPHARWHNIGNAYTCSMAAWRVSTMKPTAAAATST